MSDVALRLLEHEEEQGQAGTGVRGPFSDQSGFGPGSHTRPVFAL